MKLSDTQEISDTKGLVHSFDIFKGKIDPVTGQLDIEASGNIVLTLVIHENVNHLCTTGLPLWICLLLFPTRGYQHLVVKKNHLRGCSFSAER